LKTSSRSTDRPFADGRRLHRADPRECEQKLLVEGARLPRASSETSSNPRLCSLNAKRTPFRIELRLYHDVNEPFLRKRRIRLA
jgi:hypothetical protein